MADKSTPLTGIINTLSDHIQKFGPLLLMLGLVEKDGDKLKPTQQTSKAGAKFMGIGKDDEAITASIIALLSKQDPGGLTKARSISNWLLTLEKHQQNNFRLFLSQILTEFKNIKSGDKDSVGVDHAVEFLTFLANVRSYKKRTELAIALNIFSREKPFYEKIIPSIKEGAGSFNEETNQACLNATREFLLGKNKERKGSWIKKMISALTKKVS